MEGVKTATDQKLEFMTLLVEELKNQNPLEPMDNQQMAAQLAQFTQLEETEQMNNSIQQMNETMNALNSSFEGSMMVAQFDYARSLLGKQISFYDPENGNFREGQVGSIKYVDNQPALEVNAKVKLNDGTDELRQYLIGLGDVTGISDYTG